MDTHRMIRFYSVRSRSRVWSRRTARLLVLLLLAWLGGHVLPADVAYAAQTWYVAPDGRDRNSCRTSAAACRTIEEGLDRADDGDTIQVAAGTYEESLRIDRRLRLLGAQAAKPAPGRSSPETIIVPPEDERIAVTIRADNVELDGFTIDNSAKRSGGFGEYIGIDIPSTRNKPLREIAIRNTRFLGSTRAINVDLTSDLRITGNLIQSLNYGVYVGGTSSATTISSNEFTTHMQAAISFVLGPHRNVEIDGNVLRDNAAIVLANTTTATITNNTSSKAVGSAVQLSGGNQDVLIGDNVIMGGSGSAVRLYTSVFSPQPNRNVRVVRNTLTQNGYGARINPNGYAGTLELHFNRIAGNTSGGLLNEATATVNAENNWWGCSAGPGQSGCNTVSGTIDATPWLVLRARFAPLLRTDTPTTIGADLTFNSDGVSTAAVGTLPDRTPVSFGSTLGTVSPPIVGTVDGVAVALYIPGSAPGNAQLTVTVDYQPIAQSVPLRVGRFMPLLVR